MCSMGASTSPYSGINVPKQYTTENESLRLYDSGKAMTDFTLDELDGFWREAKKLEKVE